MFNIALVESQRPFCRVGQTGGTLLPFDRRKLRGFARFAALSALVLVAGCQTRPKFPPGARPSVVVVQPPKSGVWKQVATEADEDRIARPGLAWQEALAEAGK